MKRLYSHPLVAVQETKCAVICTALSPPFHFTVNMMTQSGGQLIAVGLDTFGFIFTVWTSVHLSHGPAVYFYVFALAI